MTTSLLLTDARVVDARGEVAPSADVEIVDGTITAIGRGDRERASRIIDVGGDTVCPGLMNAHVHLCLDAGPDPGRTYHSQDDAEMATGAIARLEETLARGVTTVRDLGGNERVTLAIARQVEDGRRSGPRVLAAGRVVTTIGGHGHWMGIEVHGADEARAAACRMIEAGAAVIKVMATAGMMTAGQDAGAPQLTREEMAACVDVAHAAGLRVAAHAEGREGAATAIDAGVDTIEHGHGLDEDLLRRMVDGGITLVPTIACDRAITSRGAAAGIPPFVVADCARLAPTLETALRRAIELGVTIAAGNDGGAPLTHPGDLADELEIYVELGMSPLRALATATTDAAAAFGMDHVGLVETGHRADLLVLSADPAQSVGALRHPRLVIAGGTVVEGVRG